MTESRVLFLDTAARIGRRLCRDAIWSDGRCNWLGWGMEPHGGQWISVYRAMGCSLYDGAAGIGLFLARLAGLTQDAIVATTAEGALAQALSAVDELRASGEYGFYSGLAGIAQSCIDAGTELDREDIIACGRDAMRICAKLDAQANRLDIINGSAGAIPVLLRAAEQFGEAAFAEAAERHGAYLLAQAARGEDGWSWDTLGAPSEPHLLGFAHGASGVAHALADLGVKIGRREFIEAALQGLRYERAHFHEAEGNWPDLRSFVQKDASGRPPCMIAWCHGAPGIGFARLRLLELLPDDADILAEAETAVRTTAATLGQSSMGVGNFSLCHGDGGNADLLLLAADALERPALRQEAEAAATRAIERFEERRAPWPCGVPGAGETPNLMLGTAGIGYFMLRLYDSQATPTILAPSARETKKTKARQAHPEPVETAAS